jgi:Domain of unknown function (DUF4349)
MSERDPRTATIERDLTAIDDALGSRVADHHDQLARELQELALVLQADSPEPDAVFAEELRLRAESGFPAAAGSPRARRQAAAAGIRDRLTFAPRAARRALPAVAVIGGILLPLVLVATLAGPPNGSDGGGGEDGGGVGGGGGAAVPEDAGTGLGREAAPAGGGSGAGGQAAPDVQAVPGGASPQALAPAPPGGGFAPGQRARKIERSIGLELEAPSGELARVADQVTAVTNRHGGFVLSSSLSTGNDGAGGDFELRIPSNRLQPALRDLAAIATVRSQSQSGRDVTREHVTAKDRLASARAERRSLLRRLEQADTDEEAEAIRRRLDLVAGEINGLRAQLRDLRLRTDYAVVTVALLASENGASEEGGAGSTFDDALDDGADLLFGTAGVLIRILALLLPLALLGLLLWLPAAALRRRRRESALA